MKVTPEFIVSFETSLQGIVNDQWKRVVKNLVWDKFMKLRPGKGKVEILTWLLESARMYPEGDGANTRFDDMQAATTSLEHENVGSGLRLTVNEIEDNQMKDNPSVSVLDYSQKWAKDTASAAAYYPQQSFFSLLTNGKTGKAYDNKAFFATDHPVNPNGGGGTYSNLIGAVPLNAAATTTEVDAVVTAQRNLGKAIAGVTTQKFLNGVPRYLRPTAILAPTALEFRLRQMLHASQLTQSDNVLREYNLSPIIAPELDAEPDVYYLAVEDTLADDLGAFIYSDRKPFTMSSYSAYDTADLARRERFEWLMKGRNTAIYGHPFLFYRCEPT